MTGLAVPCCVLCRFVCLHFFSFFFFVFHSFLASLGLVVLFFRPFHILFGVDVCALWAFSPAGCCGRTLANETAATFTVSRQSPTPGYVFLAYTLRVYVGVKPALPLLSFSRFWVIIFVCFSIASLFFALSFFVSPLPCGRCACLLVLSPCKRCVFLFDCFGSSLSMATSCR